MLNITGLGHINIIVNNIEEAMQFYMAVLGAKPISGCNHLKSEGFAKSAGFLENCTELDVSIRFLKIEAANLMLELMEYHSPKGERLKTQPNTNDGGGVRHICLNVTDIVQAFAYIKSIKNINLINTSDTYKPYPVGDISEEQLLFFEEQSDIKTLQKVRDQIKKIRFFYFIDPYGVQWELEER